MGRLSKIVAFLDWVDGLADDCQDICSGSPAVVGLAVVRTVSEDGLLDGDGCTVRSAYEQGLEI